MKVETLAAMLGVEAPFAWGLMMKTKISGVVAAWALLNISCGAVADTAFPVVPLGTTVTGSITLDPNTPLSALSILPDKMFHWLNPGFMTVSIGGGIFAAPIEAAFVQTPALTPAGPFWESTTTVGTFNGASLPPFPSGFVIMNMTLSGGTANPTSVLPESFNSYSSGDLQIVALSSLERSSYAITLTSLSQVDNVAHFIFLGTLRDYSHVAPVAGPIAGAGVPGLVIAIGGALAWWSRKRESGSGRTQLHSSC